RWRSRAVWLLPLLVAVDLIALGSAVEIETNDPTLGFHHPDVVAFLKQDPALFRIEDNAPAWQPDAALVHGLYDIGGVFNPLGLAPYQAYRWAMGERGSPLFNLLGVKYVLADKGKSPGDEPLVPVYSGSEIDVYLNKSALPRALFVTRQRVVSDHEEAWQAIHAPTFDPSRVVVLEREGTRPAQPTNELTEPSRISFVRYGLNRVELTVRCSESGWLVLSDVFYPGWRASVDGRPTPVLRANYTFRAVGVPAGDHTVSMVFAPRIWYVGLALSAITWLALAVAALRSLRASSLP
ncbi:MAG: YfhO family protein, partial [Anaerolineae bacterium]